MNDRWFVVENHAGDPIPSGDFELIPVSQAARLQIPGLPLHMIWNRPVSVITRQGDKQQADIPIQDYTRRAQIILIGAGLLGSWLLWLGFGRQR